MLSKFKYRIEGLLAIVAYPFLKCRVDPSVLTVMGLILSLAALLGSIVYRSAFLTALLLALSALVDSIDGYVARKLGRETKSGAFLDSTIDRVSDGIYIYSMYLLGIIDPFIMFLLLLGSFLISYARARGEGLGLEMAGVGLVERGERVLALILILVLYGFNKPLSEACLIIFLIATYVTLGQRMLHAYSKLKGVAK